MNHIDAESAAEARARRTWVGIILGLLGFVLLGTAAVGYCPIYHAIGLSTAEDPKTPAEAK